MMMEVEIQLPLKRFPNSSVSSLIQNMMKSLKTWSGNSTTAEKISKF